MAIMHDLYHQYQTSTSYEYAAVLFSPLYVNQDKIQQHGALFETQTEPRVYHSTLEQSSQPPAPLKNGRAHPRPKARRVAIFVAACSRLRLFVLG